MIDGHNPRILVVDDEPGVREMLRDFLEMNDFKCAMAEDGNSAVSNVRKSDFDLVIMDIRMPGLSGIEALRVIKDIEPHQQVIMVTAVAEVDTAVEAMRLGATDYVQKPFVLQEVLSKVDEALSKAALLREQEETQHRQMDEAKTDRGNLNQRTKEIEGLNKLFQRHLNERVEVDARWAELTNDINRLFNQIRDLKSKVESMDGIDAQALMDLIPREPNPN